MTSAYLVFSLWAATNGNSYLSSEELDAYVARVRAAQMNCGPLALYYCLRRQGQVIDREEVLKRAGAGEKGVKIKKLLDVSRSFGVKAKILHYDRRNTGLLPIPSILVVSSAHCIVYDGTDASGETVLIFEPYDGSVRSVPTQMIQNSWTGDVIVFREPELSHLGFVVMILITAIGFIVSKSVFLAFLKVARLLSVHTISAHGTNR
jgi:ABC-type bacteriocin/lantibiotic exporter with double-glycine peptidase domain